MNSASSPPNVAASWGQLFSGRNGWLALALTGGVALHAINVHIVTTVLPSVVADIGGLDWYAWSTTLFVVASIIGAALSVHFLVALGPRGAYLLALAVFVLGSVACASASSMAWMLGGRSVQGLGGGMLAALSYALIRVVFVPTLWPRAVALVSGMWGVATLCGPAVGGLFAQSGHWRWAFWSLLPVAVWQVFLVTWQLGAKAGQEEEAPKVASLQIGLLVASVLAVAGGSLSLQSLWQGLGAALGLGLGLAVIAVERRNQGGRGVCLLPDGATSAATALGGIYACVALLLLGTTTEIFVPYFLQTLHGLSPLAAGYLTAAMAGGWSAGSLLSSGRGDAMALKLQRVGPMLCAVSLLALGLLIPLDAAAWPTALLLSQFALALVGVGAGVGMGWPHLLTRVLIVAPKGQESMASAAITTVQLYGMAIGAALAGLVTNMAGLSQPGGVTGAQNAAVWLFMLFALAPAYAAWLIHQQLRGSGQAVAVKTG